MPVVVPEIGGEDCALQENAERIVLAGLELVAHHRHLRRAILLGDQAARHAIRLERERPVEILAAGRHRQEVVCAVEPRGRAPAGTVLVHLDPDVVPSGRRLELHVLEQVRHPRFAVAFVPRADHVRHVHGDGGLRLVGKEQNAEPVREMVLGDSFHRCDSGGALLRLRTNAIAEHECRDDESRMSH